jgi:hypothetical protein
LETIAFLSSLVLAGIFFTLFRMEKRARDAENAKLNQTASGGETSAS